MSFTDLMRKQLVVPFTVFAGALNAAGTEETKAAIANFVLPWDCIITGFQASYAIESGTGPALDLTLERGTTVLNTLAQVTTINTPVRNKGLSISASEGEQLNVKADAANTDNAFEGLVIVVEVQIVQPNT
jgi:hypothetical protein